MIRRQACSVFAAAALTATLAFLSASCAKGPKIVEPTHGESILDDHHIDLRELGVFHV